MMTSSNLEHPDLNLQKTSFTSAFVMVTNLSVLTKNIGLEMSLKYPSLTSTLFGNHHGSIVRTAFALGSLCPTLKAVAPPYD